MEWLQHRSIMASVSRKKVKKTKQQTDIDIAKAEVKRQKEHREGNFQVFIEKRDAFKKKKQDWKERLKENKYI